jgi:hypothetical protein
LETDSYVVCRYQQAGDMHVKVKGFGMSTGTSVKRQHLVDCHIDAWISSCDRLKIPVTAKAVQDAVCDYRTRQGQIHSQSSSTDPITRSPFSQEAFVNAIMNFIIADDQVWFYVYSIPINITDNFLQSINVIESPQLRAIFLMLREELKDSDIPHRTSLRQRILDVWNDHLDKLQEEMAVRSLH